MLPATNWTRSFVRIANASLNSLTLSVSSSATARKTCARLLAPEARSATSLVMDYIEGEPLDKFCEVRMLTTPERLKLFRQVCAAVHYAHQNLVVHRDLKPSNILVTADGVPKLLDGIAKILDAEKPDATATTLRLLTPEYASPNRARGEPVSTSSDMYALGVVLYELLTCLRSAHGSPATRRLTCKTSAVSPTS